MSTDISIPLHGDGPDAGAGTPALRQLHAALLRTMTSEAAAWLASAVEAVRLEPDVLGRVFAAAGRTAGHAVLAEAPPATPPWTAAAAARAVLLAALIGSGTDPGAELEACWRHGTAEEQLAVVQALSVVDTGDVGLGIVRAALRTNDERIVTAALGPFAAARLDADTYAHGVLKFVFMGIPLAAAAGLSARTTPQLSRMLASFVHERIAAGRTVPADVWPVIDAHPPADVLAAIGAELDHPAPARAAAARAALDGRA